ncbi:MAG: hypothetical protein Q9184_007723, partial [Pyrenodesmia sp. 2 TL-2023]
MADIASLLKELELSKLRTRELETQKGELEAQNDEYFQTNRPTTLEELLRECHENIQVHFQVETDLKICTKGSVTSPVGKLCPQRLVLWQEFPQLQADAYDQAHDFFHPSDNEPRRVFMSAKGIQDYGRVQNYKTMKSEADLKDWQHKNVHGFLENIQDEYGLKGSFENYPLLLGDGEEQKSRHPTNSDQVYIVPLDGGYETLIVAEFKAPHKLTAAHLRASIRDTVELDVAQIRHDRGTISPDDTAASSFGRLARYLFAAAACQTYQYLIKSGCGHGCIITGEAIVFLKVDKDHPRDLCYFLAEPQLDATTSPEAVDGLDVSKTMIAQLMSFLVMAYPPEPYSQQWRERAQGLAQVWKIDYEDVYYETPKKARELLDKAQAKMEKLDLDYKGFGGLLVRNRSPRPQRKRVPTKQYGACATDLEPSNPNKEDSGDDSNDDDHLPQTPSKPGPSKRQQSHNGQQSKQVGGSSYSQGLGGKSKGQQYQYCTQACLFGLVHRLPIDVACPNALSHPRGKHGNTHALTRPKLCQALRQQLFETRDIGCDNLQLTGSRGLLFRLTLASSGYTLVGKGTLRHYVRDLKREGQRYRRLNPLQGQWIPVYLGNIDLEIPWYGQGDDI